MNSCAARPNALIQVCGSDGAIIGQRIRKGLQGLRSACGLENTRRSRQGTCRMYRTTRARISDGNDRDAMRPYSAASRNWAWVSR